VNLERVQAIARAVLYEGYLLYPYRADALKNRQRWTFGTVFPRDYAEASGTDPWAMQTQCLVCGGDETVLSVRVRFLRVVDAPEEVEIVAPELRLEPSPYGRGQGEGGPPGPRPTALTPALSRGERESVELPISGAPLAGRVSIAADPVADGVHRVTVRIENLSPAAGLSRDAAQRLAFASAHTVLGVQGGAFVSLTDPPEHLREAAAQCRNEGTWPVLVGDPGSADTLLSSPIILPDYPQIAPESPGDLFDGSEIDEILTLRILTMTEDEKRAALAADPRARALLERTEALSPAELERLHGTWRKPRLAAIQRAGREVSLGDTVRLRPKRRADIMDTVLDGMLAIVEGIERDFEDRVHLAVTIADDPGRDLGADRYPGHRFFFALDEVEPA
jgi:hypothetical protein